MTLTAVISKNVKAVGRDGADLIVLFTSGSAYRYVGAAVEHAAMMAAPSPGRFVRTALVRRPEYPATRLTPEEVLTLDVIPANEVAK